MNNFEVGRVSPLDMDIKTSVFAVLKSANFLLLQSWPKADKVTIQVLAAKAQRSVVLRKNKVDLRLRLPVMAKALLVKHQ